MKIVLTTTPQAQGDLERAGLPFLGIGYVAKHLLNDGHEVKIVDSHTNLWDVARTVEEILKFEVDAAGITASTNNRFQAIELIRKLRQANPKLFIFAGGQHFALTHEDAMKNIPELDAIVRGEGEATTVELIRAVEGKMRFEEVLGVTYRTRYKIQDARYKESSNDKFQIIPNQVQISNDQTFDGSQPMAHDDYIVNPPRPFEKNLDELLTPAWELFEMDKYQRKMDDTDIRAIGVISSRGCPNFCAYCCNAAFGQASLRLRSPEKFVDEVEYLHKKYGFQGFDFWDDTLTVSKERVRKICSEIKRRNLNIKWYARARVNTVDKDLLQTMFDAGCIRISYGVESGSQRILEIIKKNINLGQVREAVRWSSEVGMLVTVNFMVNLPYETWDDLKQTVSLMKELKQIPRVNPCYGFTIVYPGTEMEEWARKEGWMPSDFSWNSPYESKKYKIAGVDKSLVLLEMPGLEIERVKVYMTRELAGRRLWKRAFRKIKKVKSFREAVVLVKAGWRFIK